MHYVYDGKLIIIYTYLEVNMKVLVYSLGRE